VNRDIKSHMQLKRVSYTFLWKRREVNRSIKEEAMAKEE